MKTSLALLLALSGIGVTSGALARNGDLCTKTESTFAGGSTYNGYFHLNFNRGDNASVEGRQCAMMPDGSENCFAVYGEMIAENGKIELTTTAGDELTIAPYGKMNAFATRYWSINPETLTGTGTLVSSQLVSGKVTQISDISKVTVIPCPKRTAEDQQNLRILRKFARDAGNLK